MSTPSRPSLRPAGSPEAPTSAKSHLSAGPSPRLPQPRPGPWVALDGHTGHGFDVARRRQR
eukprot:scaffold141286_cov142-Phaeocystis_antarctica.AAC.1